MKHFDPDLISVRLHGQLLPAASRYHSFPCRPFWKIKRET